MVSGRSEEGLTVIKELFGQFGQRFPGGPKRAMLVAVWEAIRFRVRGTRFRERPADQVRAIVGTREMAAP